MTALAAPAERHAWHPLRAGLLRASRRWGFAPTRVLLLVSVRRQQLWVLEAARPRTPQRKAPRFAPVQSFRISTSRFGVGQVANSHRTPLGLHRIAAKVGAGWPPGTVFADQKAVGYTWKGRPDAGIAHRILWLEGLEPGFNRGGAVDTFARCIYLHGVGDETTLGRPASRGCIHIAAADLLPLFDRLATGTLVWIGDP